ncbi:MAG: hypothetical protein AAGJ40_15705 [Planctomycetota bacterium]
MQTALDQWNMMRDQHVDGIEFLQVMRLLSGASITGNDTNQDVVQRSRIQAGNTQPSASDLTSAMTTRSLDRDETDVPSACVAC